MKNIKKLIISGGGTGGHIFPAIAIANEFKKRFPAIQILFVGAQNRMEMEKVPQAGYDIVGLNIAGIQRRLTLKNLAVPFKLAGSLLKARKVLKTFDPDLAIGVGGYASAPLIFMASLMKIPTLIQEQNSYAGITNKWLAKRVNTICVAYPDMDQYFPKEKIIFSGNPVRADLLDMQVNKKDALKNFQLSVHKKTIFVMGGSLGARSINEAIQKGVKTLIDKGYQIIWQTGKAYFNKAQELVKKENIEELKVFDFVYDMDKAYSAADLIVSRAGALSISELCVVAKPCILIPSPNVAEDHQTKNAQSVCEKGAAVLVKDNEALDQLIIEITNILENAERQEQLSHNIAQLSIKNATERIVDEALKIIKP